MTSLTVRLLVVASLAVPTAVAFSAPAAAHGSQAPVVTQVILPAGSTVGYADVIVDGRRFTSDSTVLFGGVKATRVRELSSHTLAVSAPPHGHGVKNVVVRTSHGTSALTKASRYTYVHATLPGTWTSSRAALPAGTGTYDDLRLIDNSCPSVSTCYSIGSITDDYVGSGDPPTSGTRPVIRTRSGSSYSLINAPMPADIDRAELSLAEIDAIDCPSVGSCAAVGSYPALTPNSSTGFTVHVLLLSLSGGTWHAQAAPTGSVVTSTDYISFEDPPAVSCGAPGNCVVGVFVFGANNNSDAAGVLYRLSGTTWTGARPVAPSGGEAYGVDYVSCPTATYCAASLDSYPNTYLDVLSNGSWTPTTVRAPAGTAQKNYRPDVIGLKCAAPQQCTALLNNVTATVSSTFFDRIAGSGQTLFNIPTPGDADPTNKPSGYEAGGDSYTPTLVCPAVTVCYATNVYEAKAGKRGAQQWVVARLYGSSLHVYVMPEPVGTGSARTFLRNLACPSVNSCVAVGWRGTTDPAAAYVTFANNVWTPGSLPTVANQPSPSQGQFVDLACVGVGACFADADYAWDREYSEVRDEVDYARSTDLDAVLTPN